ncbi:hypothetical protein EON80_26660 [bacterium]|nr:MAG: hypothetical protein EON80_26660 [bacterium]
MNASGDDILPRVQQIIFDALRLRRASAIPPPPSRIKITKMTTVDATWEKEIVPKATDDLIRVRIFFDVECNGQSGDLQSIAKLGDVVRVDDRLNGLKTGSFAIRFAFEVPKEKEVPFEITIDTLGTGKNTTPQTAHIKTTLKIQ